MINDANVRTVVELSFDGVDITESISNDLKYCAYAESESGADDFQIALRDRSGIWLNKWLPQIVATPNFAISAKAIQENWWGDGRDKVFDIGRYRYNGMQPSGPPDSVIIKATAKPFGRSVMRTPKTRSFESIDLRGIAERIASEACLLLVFQPLLNPHYKRVEQENVSDIVFLKNLCKDVGASLKITSDCIAVIDRVAFIGNPAVVTIRKNDDSYKKYSLDIDEEDGVPVYVAEFKMCGNTDLLSVMPIDIVGFGVFDGRYIIENSYHNFGSDKYITNIVSRRRQEVSR